MKPMGPLPVAPPDQGQPPMGAPPPPLGGGGFLGPPPAAPQGQGGPMPPQGQPMPGGDPMGGQEGVNGVANNALMLLHDEQAGPAFDQLIGQGPEGAGQALAELYGQLRQGYEAQGQQMDEEEAGDAIAMVLGDVWQIGQASGGLRTPEDMTAAMQHGFALIGERFPDVAADMQASAAEAMGGQDAPMPPGAPPAPMGA